MNFEFKSLPLVIEQDHERIITRNHYRKIQISHMLNRGGSLPRIASGASTCGIYVGKTRSIQSEISELEEQRLIFESILNDD